MYVRTGLFCTKALLHEKFSIAKRVNLQLVTFKQLVSFAELMCLNHRKNTNISVIEYVLFAFSLFKQMY